MDITRKIHHREWSSNPDLRSHPTYLWTSLRTSHDDTSPILVTNTRRDLTPSLPPSKWCFVCINSEKCFRTVWKELDQEFPVVFDQCVEQTLWNTARDTELRRPLTQVEEMWRKTGIPHEQITRPDGIVFKMTTKTKAGVIWLLEFKCMSDVTSHYIVRTKRVTETQYVSLGSAVTITVKRQVCPGNKKVTMKLCCTLNPMLLKNERPSCDS